LASMNRGLYGGVSVGECDLIVTHSPPLDSLGRLLVGRSYYGYPFLDGPSTLPHERPSSSSLSVVRCAGGELGPCGFPAQCLLISRFSGGVTRGCGSVAHPLSPTEVGHQSLSNRPLSNKTTAPLFSTSHFGLVWALFIVGVLALYSTFSSSVLTCLQCALVVAVGLVHEKVPVGFLAELAAFFGNAGDLSTVMGWRLASHVLGHWLVPSSHSTPSSYYSVAFCLSSCYWTVAEVGCWLRHAISKCLTIPLPNSFCTAGVCYLVGLLSCLFIWATGELVSPLQPLPFFSKKLQPLRSVTGMLFGLLCLLDLLAPPLVCLVSTVVFPWVLFVGAALALLNIGSFMDPSRALAL